MIKPYEAARIMAEPFLPALYRLARKQLAELIRESKKAFVGILDIGGRRSPYTAGLGADITVIDLPRKEEVQYRLGLGLEQGSADNILKRRSNVSKVIIDDFMTHQFKKDSFDAAVAVEVIEHIKDDDAFVSRLAGVLKPEGWAFITTPNGDHIKNVPPNFNPDHARHYRKEDLCLLLKKYFKDVKVFYAVRTGKFRGWGLNSFSFKSPIRTLLVAASNIISNLQSMKTSETDFERYAHLFAVARSKRI